MIHLVHLVEVSTIKKTYLFSPPKYDHGMGVPTHPPQALRRTGAHGRGGAGDDSADGPGAWAKFGKHTRTGDHLDTSQEKMGILEHIGNHMENNMGKILGVEISQSNKTKIGRTCFQLQSQLQTKDGSGSIAYDEFRRYFVEPPPCLGR